MPDKKLKKSECAPLFMTAYKVDFGTWAIPGQSS